MSPVIDLLFLGSLALWGLAQFRITHLPQLWTAADVERSVLFFIGFMLIDLLTCIIAFLLERHEDWSLLWPLLLQRFYYRQMMYMVLFRAVKQAVKGRHRGLARRRTSGARTRSARLNRVALAGSVSVPIS